MAPQNVQKTNKKTTRKKKTKKERKRTPRRIKPEAAVNGKRGNQRFEVNMEHLFVLTVCCFMFAVLNLFSHRFCYLVCVRKYKQKRKNTAQDRPRPQ